MVRIPRSGTHNGIKYNKKRTLVRLCIICKTFFVPNRNRDKTCSIECRKIMKSNNWSNWFNQLSPDARQKYIGRSGNTERRQTFEAEQRDMRRLYKEVGIAYPR